MSNNANISSISNKNTTSVNKKTNNVKIKEDNLSYFTKPSNIDKIKKGIENDANKAIEIIKKNQVAFNRFVSSKNPKKDPYINEEMGKIQAQIKLEKASTSEVNNSTDLDKLQAGIYAKHEAEQAIKLKNKQSPHTSDLVKNNVSAKTTIAKNQQSDGNNKSHKNANKKTEQLNTNKNVPAKKGFFGNMLSTIAKPFRSIINFFRRN